MTPHCPQHWPPTPQWTPRYFHSLIPSKSPCPSDTYHVSTFVHVIWDAWGPFLDLLPLPSTSWQFLVVLRCVGSKTSRLGFKDADPPHIQHLHVTLKCPISLWEHQKAKDDALCVWTDPLNAALSKSYCQTLLDELNQMTTCQEMFPKIRFPGH